MSAVSPEATRMVREVEDGLRQLVEKINHLRQQSYITIQFTIGVGPSGKQEVTEFVALAPIDLRKSNS